MTILYPEFAWLFLILVPMGYLSLVTFRRRTRDLDVLAGKWRGPRIKGLFFLKTAFREFFFLGGLFLLILALMGLQWGVVPEEEEGRGLQVALVLDISRSMLTEDVRPNRLEQATGFLKGVIDSFPGESFSLSVFKGDALTLVPLTYDRTILDQYLDQVGPSYLTSPGSDVEKGLIRGWRSLQNGIPNFKAVILISDGENLQGNPRQSQITIRDEKGELFVFSVGTSQGARIPLSDGSFVTDASGREVVSRARPEFLRSFAQEGQFSRLENPRALRNLVDALKIIGAPQDRGGVAYREIPRYWMFLAGALLLFVLEMLFRIWKWKKVF